MQKSFFIEYQIFANYSDEIKLIATATTVVCLDIVDVESLQGLKKKALEMYNDQCVQGVSQIPKTIQIVNMIPLQERVLKNTPNPTPI